MDFYHHVPLQLFSSFYYYFLYFIIQIELCPFGDYMFVPSMKFKWFMQFIM